MFQVWVFLRLFIEIDELLGLMRAYLLILVLVVRGCHLVFILFFGGHLDVELLNHSHMTSSSRSRLVYMEWLLLVNLGIDRGGFLSAC